MKKLNNKGFSLVELIIVIAIMAILVGIVGTQIIPYLENSRKAKDQQVLSAWNTAAMSAYSNAAAKVDAEADYEIQIGASSFSVAVTNGKPDVLDGKKSIKNFFSELTGITSGYDFDKMESKAGKNINNVTISIRADGVITTTTSCDGSYTFDVIENK